MRATAARATIGQAALRPARLTGERMPGQWRGSDRHSALPTHWPAVRLAVLRRDHGTCTWLGGPDTDGRPAEYLTSHYDDQQRCTTPATDVDHISDPGDHRPQNLRSLCRGHHAYRSARQGVAARDRLAALQPRPPMRHPGLRNGC